MTNISRRAFLRTSARASAASAVLAGTGSVAGAASRRDGASPQPSDKVRVALVGCGGQGKSNLGAFLRLPEVECPVVADVDATHLADGLKLVSNARGKAAEGVKDFRRILDRQDVDAVIVATPDHWHPLIAVLACQAGKDVYVEKPLARSIGEGRAIVAAARRYRRVVQVGQQQRSSRHFRAAVEFVKSGKLGLVRMVRAWAYLDCKGDIGLPPDEPPPPELDYDLWLGPAPDRPYNRMRVHHNFRWVWDYSGGLQTDWGAHMIDVVLWAMGEEPLAAASSGGKFGFPADIRETPDTQQSLVEFPSFTLVWEHMIGCGVGPWSREHGCEFHGENGLLVVDRGGWEVHSETDQFKQPERVYRMGPVLRQGGGQDFHFEHVKNFIDCIRSRKTPVGDAEVGHRAILPAHLANIAYRLGRKVRWDAKNERFWGDDEAQALLGRDYRKPWALPEE